MLKYKQIWHRIKPTRWLIKFNLTKKKEKRRRRRRKVKMLKLPKSQKKKKNQQKIRTFKA